MDYKKILKLSLATFVMTVFLFLLSFKVVMFIVKKEIKTPSQRKWLMIILIFFYNPFIKVSYELTDISPKKN